MTAPAPSPTKVCIRCGLDCSTRPRTKDQQGRYTCRECYDAHQNEQAIVLPPSPRRSEHRIEPISAAAPLAVEGGFPGGSAGGEADEPGNNIYDLMLDDAVQAAAKITSAPCPGCGRSLKSDAALCVHCGYNTRTGKALSTKEGTESPGALPMTEQARARKREREISAWAAKMEYIKPLIMMLVGLAITCTLLNNRGASTESIMTYLMVYGISLPVAVGGFMFCCMLWLGFDAPLGLVLVRLAGIFAVMDIIFVGIGWGGRGMGMGFGVGLYGMGFRFLLPLLVFTGLLMHFMDLDYEDALLTAALTGLIKIIGTFVLLAWMAGLIGG